MKSAKWICVGLMLLGVVMYGVAARYEQLTVNEIGLTKITLGGTEVTATAAELNSLHDALSGTITLSNVTHLIVVNGIVRDTSPTTLE